MAGMEGHGRLFDVVPVAGGTLIALENAAGVTFVVTATTDTETFTLKSASGEAGSPSVLATITQWYVNASQSGADGWTTETQAAADTFTVAAGSSATVYVDSSDLPAGANYVSLTASGSGTATVMAIVHDLAVQRTPANLLPLTGASS